MNPYYDPEKLDLDMISFNEPNMCYEYNTLCFWATKDGQIYAASDSGCSCPTPFENGHDRETRDEVIQTLERVASPDHAASIFEAWAKGYSGTPFLGPDECKKARDWVAQRLVG